MVNALYNATLPKLPIIRRVPTRYQGILPLTLMKQLQCTVVGAARGVLTVAICDSQQVTIIASLEKISGRRIFFVLVDPASMRLLISRLERCEHRKCREALGRPCYLHRLQLHAFLCFLPRTPIPTRIATPGAQDFRLLHAPEPSPE